MNLTKSLNIWSLTLQHSSWILLNVVVILNTFSYRELYEIIITKGKLLKYYFTAPRIFIKSIPAAAGIVPVVAEIVW